MKKGSKVGRKRKVPIADEEKENEESTAADEENTRVGPIFTIMSNVQLNETFHKRYIKELKQIYAKMDHDAFFFTFLKMIKPAMEADECNEYAHTTLLFCSKFVTSYDTEDTHPLLVDTCKWLLTSISNNPHIRFRLCQFVNMLLTALGVEAALDDVICDNILEYMLERLRDMSPTVRVQAILAMQRLQVPDNPDDPVLRAYQFHLCSDPSPRVRQAVITCMGRNYHTIPFILDRLWDIDEKVRRHTYLHMSSYPLRSYKVSQRLILLEQGLNDRSELVRKVVVTILLKQWIETYQKDLIGLVSALKLDSNEAEINRFRKITKQTLKVIFNSQNADDLLACLPLEEDGEYHRCVPHDKLTIEIAFYWQCLTEHLQTGMAEESDLVVPELSTFCAYVEHFCVSQKSEMDKFEELEFQYTLLSLVEILYIYDLGDEIGRGNLKKLLANLLKNFNLEERVIAVIVRCVENLITDQNARLQYFLEIVQDMCALNGEQQNDLVNNRSLINELLASSTDGDLNLKLSSLKVKILDLEEQAMNAMQQKDFVKAHELSEAKAATTEEYMNLLRPLLAKHTTETRSLQLGNVVKKETILKSLQIAFHMVVSPKVNQLNPNICNLYKVFICRHIGSSHIALREWALKCGTAYSMLYEAFAKEVFDELYSQFFKNHNIRIWHTSVECIFELLERYGIDTFAGQGQQNKAKKSGRQLYNTLKFLDADEESVGGGNSTMDQGVGVIYMMSHFLDTCADACIVSAIIKGFCRLVLRGHIKSSEIVEKLLLCYFNPATDPAINQILGVFLDNLIQRKQHTLLEPALLPTVTSVLSASYDSPLHDIRPETIMRFVIDATRQEQCGPSSAAHIHNKIALSFLQEMLNNLPNKEACKLLAKELTTLELNVLHNDALQRQMREQVERLIKADFDSRTVKHLIMFKDMLDGIYNPQRKSTVDNDSDEEADDETVAATVTRDDDVTTTNASAANDRRAANSLPIVEEETSGDSVAAASQPAVDEQPKTPVPAPPASTHTTFGPDNVASHRHLRKSLNLSRSQSIETAEATTPTDGPTRPNKIRIEMRIDSDKKSSAEPAAATHIAPPSPSKGAQRRPRAAVDVKRSLRYGTRSAAAQSEKESVQAPPAKTAPRPQQQRKHKAVETGKAARTTQSGVDSPTSESEQEAAKSPRLNKRWAGRAPAATSAHPSPTSATRRKRADQISLMLDSPDMIPSSSPEVSISETTKLGRLRQMTRQLRPTPTSPARRSEAAVVTPSQQQRTRSKSFVAPTPPPPTKATRSATGGGDDSTLRRNGRKRVLPQQSPRATTIAGSPVVAAGSSETSASSPQSPIRKQQCVEGGDGGGGRTARARTQIPALVRHRLRSVTVPASSAVTGSESERETSQPARSLTRKRGSLAGSGSGSATSSSPAGRPQARAAVKRMRPPPPSRIPVRTTTNSSDAASCSSGAEEAHRAKRTQHWQTQPQRCSLPPPVERKRALAVRLTRMQISQPMAAFKTRALAGRTDLPKATRGRPPARKRNV